MNDNIISIKQISFSYDKKEIYNSFSFDILNNDICFIMGINGSGKTTLLKIICALLDVKNGEIEINKTNLKLYDSKSLAKVLAYVPQTIGLNSDFMVKDYLALGRTPYKRFIDKISDMDYELVEKYADELNILDLLECNFNELSGGQKQIVAICRALIQETPIIVMDEPMSALDLGKQAEFLSLILKLKQKGKTIVLTTHNPNHALAIKEDCSVCFINNGKILSFGKCNDVITKENINLVFGDKVVFNDDNIIFNV